nr:hemagglutinin repeat-containing protein [Variovorax guangxiensis]
MRIDGAGLDASKTDYAAILARAVEVNAGIWANELKVVAGAAQLSADAAQTGPLAGSGAAPAFALDVAALGGMYAGKITLVGTEAGVGVRNAGHIGAGAGGLVVTAAGRLENKGTLEGAKVALSSAADIDNRGGTIRQAGTRELAITAPVLSNTAGGFIGAEPVAQPEPGSPSASNPDTANNAGTGSVAPTTGTSTTTGAATPAIGEPAPLQPAPATGPGAITATGSVLNDGGRIYAGGEIALNTPRIDNTGGSLTVGTMAVTGERFSNAGGTLNVARSFSADVGRFDNTGGTLRAGSLAITATGDVLNVDGTSSSASNAYITAGGSLDNTRGSMAAGGAIDARAGDALRNAGGEVFATQGLALGARSLDNRGGKLQSASGARLDVRTTGALVNTAGAILAGGDLGIEAEGFDNAGGSATAAAALSVRLRGALDNRTGTLAANTGVAVTAKNLSNASGSIAAIHGDLRVATDDGVDNAAGKLQAEGSTVIAASGVGNVAGTISGRSVTLDVRGHALDNTQGTVVAATTLGLQSGELMNDAGLIQSGGAMTIDTGTARISNRRAVDHLEGQGGITSGGALWLRSGEVDNTAGFIGAKAPLDANTRGLVNAQGGVVLSESTLSMRTHDGDYDNRGGQTQSVGALHLDAGAVGSLMNRGGLIRADADVTIDAAHVDNGATLGTDQGIEGGKITIRTATLDNVAGAIRADASATVEARTRVDNSGGLISAVDTVRVIDPGTGAKTLAVVNVGGTLVANKGIELDAATLQGNGKLHSGKNLALAFGQDVLNDGEISAVGDLTYRSGGKLTNRGKLVAGQHLDVHGAEVENTEGAEMSGDSTTVGASGTLTNQGLIDGHDTRIDAGALVNGVTGRIYGDHLSIAAGSVLNDGDGTRGGTIAARERLDIGASSIENRNGALILSAGDMAIGGALDADRHATGKAGVLTNHAATIEALGNLDISAGTLKNTNGGVTWMMVPGDSTHVVEYAVSGSAQRWKASDVLFAELVSLGGWSRFSGIAASDPYATGSNPNYKLLLPSPDYPLTKFARYYADSPKNSADFSYVNCTGGDSDNCETVTLLGTWFAIGDPIWADFGVTPPTAELSAGNPGRSAPNMTVGQIGTTILVGDPGGMVEQLIPFDHPVTQAEYDEWQAYRQAHAKLDQATAKFTSTMIGTLFKEGRMHAIYDAWDYTARTDALLMQSSAPAKILAGGTMRIDVAHGLNDMSQILAGGALTVTGGAIANVGKEVDALTVRSGATVHSSIKEHTFGSDERVYESAAYNLTTPRTVTLVAARQEGTQAINGSGKVIDGVAMGPAGPGAQGSASVAPGVRVNPIVEVQAEVGAGTPTLIRTSTPPSGLPSASLFRTTSSGHYLIETDPRFANQRQWLSSDYLLNNLGLDPSNILKRLGDGFYEQKLIREQIAQLTGHRYLDGFTSDNAQYTALMNAGVTFARAYGLRPGIGLTAAQMAQLTSDIVWLVEQSVTLPDGSTQRVLVPQVYVRVKPGDIDGSGGLISGRSVDMKLSGDLRNASGTIAGRTTVRLDADNVHNLGGRITGNDVAIKARTDLDNIGGTIDAASRVKLDAGRDIRIESTTRTVTSSTGALPGKGSKSGVDLADVALDRVAGVYVTGAGGTLTATAGRDIQLIGAQVDSAGDLSLKAGRDLNIDSVTTGRQEDIRWNGKMSRSTTESTETGTTIAGAGSVTLKADRDITARAASLSAGDTLTLDAGRDLTLYAGQNQTSAETSHATKSGMRHYSLDATGQETSLARTTLSATDIRLRSGNDTVLAAVEANASTLDIQTGGKLIFATQTTTDAARRRAWRVPRSVPPTSACAAAMTRCWPRSRPTPTPWTSRRAASWSSPPRPPPTQPAGKKPRAMRPSSPRQAKATWTRRPTTTS